MSITPSYQPREYWTRVAQEVEKRSHKSVLAGDDTPFFLYKRTSFLTKFLDQMPVQEKAVLEVGSGPGGNLVRIAKAQPRKLVGCDIAEGMIALARSNTRDLREVDIVQVNGTDLPFKDRSFDITYTVTVLQHNLDDMLAKLLPEICRVTDNRLYLFEDTGTFKQEKFSFVLRPVSEYAALCKAHGFELIETEPIGLYVSDRVSSALRTVFSMQRKEGEPIAKVHLFLEQVALPVTRRLDNLIPQRRGLTKLVFQRRS